MPREAKPLFRPDVLYPHLKAFKLPTAVEALRSKLKQWARLLATDIGMKETELRSDFFADVFKSLLGYRGPVEADGDGRYSLSVEKHVVVDGKYADAVLGNLNTKSAAENRIVVAVEGKGPLDPLDRPFAGRKRSAVEQGYQYAINLRCDWIVVTSMRQTRLYYKSADQQTYESFDIERLANDELHLKRFVYLLGAERVVPPTGGRCHLHDLLAASEKAGQELTKEFYVQYAGMRRDSFEKLRAANPNIAAGDVLTATQKLLDRVLFCAFCEDRGLLPAETLATAYAHSDLYNPRPIWENFRGLFRAVDAGNKALKIDAYNGGLFAVDPVLDTLDVPDEVCKHFRELGDFDYRAPTVAAESDDRPDARVVDVDILGHIFEQSITDLEQLRNKLNADAPAEDDKQRSRRQKEGAFYTPAFITRYIVAQTLNPVLADSFETLRAAHQENAAATAKRVLADPRAYSSDTVNENQRKTLVKFWHAWQDELERIRLVDPACGSGAFLIEAFDQMLAQYQEANARLKDLRGEATLFDPDRTILEKNIYGVDLNAEAVQICRLSLWIKTAQRGKALTSLDHTVRWGNSIIDDSTVHPRAFDWRAAFPEVFSSGGFDVVIGNPPYVRQEQLSPFKPYLEKAYKSFHGMADLYVYFYELGMKVLKPGGRLSFIVTNKWMKAGYGEPLRRFFSDETWMESVVDFGHAKQIFEDADVFPCIIVARKPLPQQPAPEAARVCAIPREQLRIHDLSAQIEADGFAVPRAKLGVGSWMLEPKEVGDLMAKIRERGVPLAEFAGVKPLRGILTGFNEAFLIDTPTRNALVKADPKCEPLIRKYLRGQDINRWRYDWAGQWMIALKSSANQAWPWASSGEAAESVFSETWPALYRHMKQYENELRARNNKGRYWWELNSIAFWPSYDVRKILYQEIQFHPSYCIDDERILGNNKTFILPTSDKYILAVLNSPLMWWFNWRHLPHMKDEALSPMAFKMEELPIARPNDQQRAGIEQHTERLLTITAAQQTAAALLLDWLKVEYEIEKPSQKLAAFVNLNSDAFVAEVKKIRGVKKPLSATALAALRAEHARTVVPAQAQAAEALKLEHAINDLVNAAYDLTSAEITLMWKTAPPRMPISKPGQFTV